MQFVKAAYETIHASDSQIDKQMALYVHLHQVQTVASRNVSNFATELFGAALSTRMQNGDLHPAEADYPGEEFMEAEHALIEAIREEIQKGLPKGAL
ncbi:hypothetical protein [Actinomadura madurae]|uniref:hypothetical protein n=1 Tax=Actinomadura madurae TaxID=1993 RepID=UPI001160C398|nr:hypothetical protein [Actinomadura madurae]